MKQLVPNTAKFALVLDRGGDYQVVNDLYIRNTVTVWSGTHLEATANDIADWWDAECKPLVNAAYTLATIEFEDLGADPGITGFISPANAGTRSGNIAPGITSILVRFAGQSGAFPRKGGNYFVGGSEGDVDGSKWTDAYCDSVEDAYSAFASVGQAFDAWVIVSRFLNTAKRDEGVTNLVGDVSVRQVVSPQKRRRQRVSAYRT